VQISLGMWPDPSRAAPSRSRVGRATLLLPLLAVVNGCSLDVALPKACAADVTVSIGPVPSFSWTPACEVQELEVRRVTDDTLVWRVFNPSPGGTGQNISPPVQYGVTPPGTAVNTPPEALASGQDYSVWVGSLNVSVGSATFTHTP